MEQHPSMSMQWQTLYQAGAAAVTLADNSLANVRISNMALGALMKERYGLQPHLI